MRWKSVLNLNSQVSVYNSEPSREFPNQILTCLLPIFTLTTWNSLYPHETLPKTSPPASSNFLVSFNTLVSLTEPMKGGGFWPFLLIYLLCSATWFHGFASKGLLYLEWTYIVAIYPASFPLGKPPSPIWDEAVKHSIPFHPHSETSTWPRPVNSLCLIPIKCHWSKG